MGVKLYKASITMPAASGPYSANYVNAPAPSKGARNKTKGSERGFFISAFLEVDEEGFFDLKIMSSISLVIYDTDGFKGETSKVHQHFRDNFMDYLPMDTVMSPFEVDETVRLYHEQLDVIVQEIIEKFIKKGKVRIAPEVPLTDNLPEYTNDGVVIIPATNCLYNGRQKAVLN